MENMPDPKEWAAARARVVGEAVAERRKELGISAAELASRTEQLGYPMARGAIAKIETGRRQGIEVAELTVLATALYMPPVALLYPRPDGATRYLPLSRPVGEDRAIRWFTGQQDIGSVRPWDQARFVEALEAGIDPEEAGEPIVRGARLFNTAAERMTTLVSWGEAIDEANRLTRQIDIAAGRGDETKGMTAQLRDVESERTRLESVLSALGVQLPKVTVVDERLDWTVERSQFSISSWSPADEVGDEDA
ncbi:helix-turn-helix domain-containing protein [Gordonia humi]|uniref:Transcriptional regulator with XRE-family HTH domain n=1 Tax=Gordonia humi TaxID=686429 RepID=A0A840ESI9_9ACTN|nr:helix-turn-helix domain-containing protein [Gordonia humi]MBB4134652.1 transcriptional regulator with XRE-family HTH domain [Gordonia humi]